MSAAQSPASLATRWATRLGFFIAGFALSVWAPMVPYVRERISMSDASFGLLLLCVGVGSLICMPLSGALAAKHGIRSVALTCISLLVIALFFMANTQSIWLLAIALFCFGGTLGVLDVVLNIQSLMVEKATGEQLMSNFHGMFSLGTISGSLLLTLLLTLGIPALPAALSMIALIILITLPTIKGTLSTKVEHSGSSLAWPRGIVLLVGALCFIVYLAEGAILDWSALYLTQDKAMATSQAGLGYASFALMVTVGRFLGKHIVERLGHALTIISGSLIAAAGISISVVAEHWSLALLGYALCGLGCANISPLLISSLSKQSVMPVHLAVTAATTVGFAGVLAGPAIMGLIAHYSSLAAAFLMLTLLLACIAPLGRVFSR